MLTKNIVFSGLFAFAMIGLVPLTHAADTTVKNQTTTGVTTDVGTVQDSGVTIGDKAKIRGDVYTGSNTAATTVETDVSSKTTTDAAAADDDINTNDTTVGTVKSRGSVTTSADGDTMETKSQREAHWNSGNKAGHTKQEHYERRER